MLKKHLAALFLFLMSLFIFTGCNTSSAKKAPDVTLQKKIISTYLEGIRDKDSNKIYGTISYTMRRGFTIDPQMKQFFSNFEQQVGAIKKWTFSEKDIYLDDLNGQAIIKTNIITSKRNLPMDIDLRRGTNGNWFIYAINISDSGKKEISPDIFEKAHLSKDKKD